MDLVYRGSISTTKSYSNGQKNIFNEFGPLKKSVSQSVDKTGSKILGLNQLINKRVNENYPLQ